MWRITVDEKNGRVQWNEKVFTTRESLQTYLDYFGIKDYNGPGQYEDNLSCNDYNSIVIDFIDNEGVCHNGR